MYEALRHFDTQLPDGKVVRMNPGDEVIGFELWPAANQMAFLNCNYVRVRPADLVGQNLAQRPSVEQMRVQKDAALAANRLSHDQDALRRRALAEMHRRQPVEEEMEMRPVETSEQAAVAVEAELAEQAEAALLAHAAEAEAGPGAAQVEPPSESEQAEAEAEDRAMQALTCHHCDFQAASEQGLKLHLTRKHKG